SPVAATPATVPLRMQAIADDRAAPAHPGATGVPDSAAVAPRCAPTAHIRRRVDVGATPALVSLRLEQAIDVLQGDAA
ncbi:hypothetical protein ABQZ29_23110, partial [Xanthomonas sp. WHRI 10200]